MLYVATYALACSLPIESHRLWNSGPATVGEEEVGYAMWPAPVGTHSSGKPLPLHTDLAAQP